MFSKIAEQFFCFMNTGYGQQRPQKISKIVAPEFSIVRNKNKSKKRNIGKRAIFLKMVVANFPKLNLLRNYEELHCKVEIY